MLSELLCISICHLYINFDLPITGLSHNRPFLLSFISSFVIVLFCAMSLTIFFFIEEQDIVCVIFEVKIPIIALKTTILAYSKAARITVGATEVVRRKNQKLD